MSVKSVISQATHRPLQLAQIFDFNMPRHSCANPDCPFVIPHSDFVVFPS